MGCEIQSLLHKMLETEASVNNAFSTMNELEKLAEKLQNENTEYSINLEKKESKINVLSENFAMMEKKFTAVKSEKKELEMIREQVEEINTDLLIEIEKKKDVVKELTEKVSSTELDLSVAQSEKSDLLCSLSSALNQMSDISLMQLRADGCSASFEAEVTSLLRSQSHEEKYLGESFEKFKSSLISKCSEMDKEEEEKNNSRISELQTLVEELQSKLKLKEGKLTQLENDFENTHTALEAKEVETNLRCKELEALNDEIFELKTRNDELSINFQQSIFSLDQKEREYVALKSQMEEDIENYKSNLSQKEEEYNSLQSKFEASTNALKAQEDALSLRGNEFEADTASDEVSELKTRNIELSSNLNQAYELLGQKERECLELKSQMEKEIESYKSSLSQKEEEYNSMQSKFEASTNALKAQEDVQSLGGHADELRSKIAL